MDEYFKTRFTFQFLYLNVPYELLLILIEASLHNFSFDLIFELIYEDELAVIVYFTKLTINFIDNFQLNFTVKSKMWSFEFKLADED